MKCHMCDSETDWLCRDCDQPVCEDCTVKMTYHNQIDYTKCQDCHDYDNAQDYLERSREWEIEAAMAVKKEIRRKARHTAYWKPDAIKKRQIAKELRQKEEAERYQKQMEKAVKTIAEMFRGMV